MGGDSAIVAMCAAKLNEQDCQYCCQTSQFQVSDAAEKALCTTGCQNLPSKTGVEKRFLFEDLTGDNLKKDAAIIAECELKPSKAECEACCNAADFVFLASVETPACVAGCSLTHQNSKRGIFDTLQQETAKVMTCDAMGVEEKCHTCCETTNWGISALAATEKNLCVNSCYMLPAQSSVDKMPATAAPADNSGSGF